jgi:hypothetical protein
VPGPAKGCRGYQCSKASGAGHTADGSIGRCSSSSSSSFWQHKRLPSLTPRVCLLQAIGRTSMVSVYQTFTFSVQALCKARCAGPTVVSSQWLGPAAHTKIERKHQRSSRKTKKMFLVSNVRQPPVCPKLPATLDTPTAHIASHT